MNELKLPFWVAKTFSFFKIQGQYKPVFIHVMIASLRNSVDHRAHPYNSNINVPLSPFDIIPVLMNDEKIFSATETYKRQNGSNFFEVQTKDNPLQNLTDNP